MPPSAPIVCTSLCCLYCMHSLWQYTLLSPTSLYCLHPLHVLQAFRVSPWQYTLLSTCSTLLSLIVTSAAMLWTTAITPACILAGLVAPAGLMLPALAYMSDCSGAGGSSSHGSSGSRGGDPGNRGRDDGVRTCKVCFWSGSCVVSV